MQKQLELGAYDSVWGDAAAGWQLGRAARGLQAEYGFTYRTLGGDELLSAHRALASAWLLERGAVNLDEVGTLFLDEIGEITAATQVKLLRFLQSRTFVPLGATQERSVSVRVISATNRDLAAAVREGAFREDFYYRLNVFAIEVPPLRARREDILRIAEQFLAARGMPASKLSRAARERLLEHPWPGNVREMENALERALILAGAEEIHPRHLGAGGTDSARSRRAAEVIGEGFSLDAFELELIHAAIERAGGNKTHAAKLLGISRRRLYSLLSSLAEPETGS
jgi:transcriptional regulator with PAS, ATPase and Fis domain